MRNASKSHKIQFSAVMTEVKKWSRIRIQDRITINERTKLLPSLIADVGHICRLPENTPASQALQLWIEAHTGTPPAADWKRPPGRPRRNWLQQLEEDTGLSVGAAWIAGQDRSTLISMISYIDPQLVKRSSEWVSELESQVNLQNSYNTSHHTFSILPHYLAKIRSSKLW